MKFQIFLLLVIPGIALGSAPSFYVSTRPCTISIESVKPSGERQGLRFTTRFRKMEECRQLAVLHEPNFEGALVKSKRVSYEWNKTTKTKKPFKFIRGYTRVAPKKMRPILAKFRRK